MEGRKEEDGEREIGKEREMAGESRSEWADGWEGGIIEKERKRENGALAKGGGGGGKGGSGGT